MSFNVFEKLNARCGGAKDFCTACGVGIGSGMQTIMYPNAQAPVEIKQKTAIFYQP